MTTASICTIGDEILIGQITDTNSAHISRALNSLGIKVTRMLSIGDEHDTIIEGLEGELRRNDIVIVTGGLGPTKDDITKLSPAIKDAVELSPGLRILKGDLFEVVVSFIIYFIRIFIYELF